jgi:hypothetical protein
VNALVLSSDNLIISVLLMPFIHNSGIFFLVSVFHVLFIYLFICGLFKDKTTSVV